MKYLNSHQIRNDMDRLSAESCPVYTEALDRWTNEGGALGTIGRAHRHGPWRPLGGGLPEPLDSFPYALAMTPTRCSRA